MTYYEKKEEVRQIAIELQRNQDSISYLEIILYQFKLELLARKYGLLKEFRENGIL